MDRGAWSATVPGLAKSQTRLSTYTYVCVCAYVCVYTHTHTHIYIYMKYLALCGEGAN